MNTPTADRADRMLRAIACAQTSALAADPTPVPPSVRRTAPSPDDELAYVYDQYRTLLTDLGRANRDRDRLREWVAAFAVAALVLLLLHFV